MFKDFISSLFLKMGYIDSEEAVARTIADPVKQKRAREIRKKIGTLDGIKSGQELKDLTHELGGILKESSGNKSHMKRTKDAISLVSMSDLYGYKPAMSRIYGLFQQNPMGAFAFVARHHPAIRACIQVILDEITNDGFVLIAQKGVTRKRLKEVYRKN